MNKPNAKAPRAGKTEATKKPTAAPKRAPAGKKKATTASGAPAVESYALFVGRNMHYVGAVLSGGRGLAPCSYVEAGKPVVVTYFQGPAGLGRPDLTLRAAKLHARVNGEEVAPLLLTGELDVGGELCRIPTAFTVPADARGELEYWFELETSGETLWDSNFGGNFRLQVGAEGVAGAVAVRPLASLLSVNLA